MVFEQINNKWFTEDKAFHTTKAAAKVQCNHSRTLAWSLQYIHFLHCRLHLPAQNGFQFPFSFVTRLKWTWKTNDISSEKNFYLAL